MCGQVGSIWSYIWSITRSQRNHKMMREQGNVESGKQYSIEVRTVIYSELKAEKDEPQYGSIKRVMERLSSKHGLEIPRRRLEILRQKYRDDNWEISLMKRAPGGTWRPEEEAV